MAPSPLDALQTALAGRYTIDREIGRGGMATVLLAHDVKHGRAVALKLLRPELAAQLGTDRFLREIEIAARLAHPNILPLLDSGVIEKGHGAEAVPYYVMPYVEGESLRDRLTHGPIPAEEVIRLVVEVADALDCAHRQGIVHRDIKPDNILLQQGHAVVSDFGIARAISAATGVARLTETGMSLGTRGYMSPEQFAGLEVDQRSDIYSLGCLTVEMLTGRPPVLGESGVARVEPATLRGPIAKALAPLPADRWNTAGEFVIALRRGGGASRRLSAWFVPVVAILAVAAVGVALLGRGSRSSGRQDPGTDSVIAHAMSLISDRNAPNVNEAMHLLGTVLQHDSANARALAGVARAYANADKWDMPIQGVPRDSLGPFAIRLSDRAISIDSLDSQVWLARATIFDFLDPGRKAGVLAAYRRSLALDSTNAETWARYGTALHDLGRPDEGLEAYRTAFRLDPRRQNYWLVLHFLWTRDLDSATKWADSAVSLTPDRYWTRNAAGHIALLAGDLATAEIHFTAAHRGETGKERGGTTGLALVAALRGDRGYARKLLDETIRGMDPERPDVHTPIYLAPALDAIGDRAGALTWLERYQPVSDLHYQLHLKFEPSLDPLRQEPRFQRLLRPLPR